MIDKNRSKALTVISLGAGVQSTTMALMSAVGELPPVDCSIFADTKNESEAVYSYLENLKKNYLFQFIIFLKVIFMMILLIMLKTMLDHLIHHYLLKM